MLPATRQALFGYRFPGARRILPTTESGWQTYSAGSRLFLPAATNYCTNPSFEVDANADGLSDGYILETNAAGAVTTTRPAAIGSGSFSQRMQYTSAADTDRYQDIHIPTAVGSFAPGEPCTVQFRCKGTVAGCSFYVQIHARDAGGGSLAQYVARPTLTETPTVFSITQASLPANTSFVWARLGCDAIDTGDTIDITVDDVLIEKSSILTPYFDGTYPNCAWTGTANASTSTRTVSALTDPLTLGSTAWTIAGRYSALWAHNDGAAHNLLTLYAGADARATVYKHTDNKLYASVADGTDTVTSASAAQTLAANTTNCFVARSTWASTVDLDLNGTGSTQGDASAVAAQTIDSIQIGGTPIAYLGPLIISPTRKSDAWVAAIQASSGAAYASLPRLWRQFMSANDMLIPLYGNSTAFLKRAGTGSQA